MSKVVKGIKLRLYPNQSQREQLWQMFGNDRFVWNQMLGMAKERYQNNPNSLFVNEYGMNYLLNTTSCSQKLGHLWPSSSRDIYGSVFQNSDYDSFTIRFIDCDILNCLVKYN